MITHTVFFWLRNAGSIKDRDELIAGVRGLAAIEQVRSLVVGVPATTADREVQEKSYNVSEILTFDSVEDEAAYQIHPLHKQFVVDHNHLWSSVTVYDVEAV